MAPSTQILISGVLTFGIPLLIGLHGMIVLKRKKGPRPPDEPPPPPPFRPKHPSDTYSKPLPACLVPQRRGVPVVEQV